MRSVDIFSFGFRWLKLHSKLIRFKSFEPENRIGVLYFT